MLSSSCMDLDVCVCVCPSPAVGATAASAGYAKLGGLRGPLGCCGGSTTTTWPRRRLAGTTVSPTTRAPVFGLRSLGGFCILGVKRFRVFNKGSAQLPLKVLQALELRAQGSGFIASGMNKS